MPAETQIVHRFWMGRTMPEAYQEYEKQWAELNPGWDVTTWGASALDLFPELDPIIQHLFDRDQMHNSIELAVQVADVMGYALIERFGGVYVNCDIQPLRPLVELPIPDRAWASYENNVDGRIVNAVIGSPIKHDPFWWALLKGLPERYFANPLAEMVETTGPAYLTDFARSRPGALHVFPTETFNPVHWKQIAPGGDASGFEYPPNAFGVHHWGHKKDGRTNLIEGRTTT